MPKQNYDVILRNILNTKAYIFDSQKRYYRKIYNDLYIMRPIMNETADQRPHYLLYFEFEGF